MVAGPEKPAAGVKLIVPSGFNVTVPCAGLTLGALTVSCALVLSTSVSFAFTLMLLIGALIGVKAVSGFATGGSLAAVTVIAVVATGEVAPWLSVTVNGILTVPLKFGAGLNTKPAACAGVSAAPAKTGVVPSARYNMPCVAGGKVVTFTEAIVPSMSVPVRLTVIGVSSAPVAGVGVAVGALLPLTTGGGGTS